MKRLLSVMLLIFVFISCTTTKIIKKETSTEIRRVEVESDTAGVTDTLDLYKISRDWEDIRVIDSTMIDVRIPKKFELPAKKTVLYLDKKTSVEVELSAVVDSGIIRYEFDVPKVVYQESTVVEHTEIDTSPTYIKWLFALVAGFIAVILFILIKK